MELIVFLFFLIIRMDTSDSGVSEKIVPTGGSVELGSRSSSLGPPLFGLGYPVAYPESRTVPVVVGDLDRTGVDLKVGEPISAEEEKDMVLHLNFYFTFPVFRPR